MSPAPEFLFSFIIQPISDQLPEITLQHGQPVCSWNSLPRGEAWTCWHHCLTILRRAEARVTQVHGDSQWQQAPSWLPSQLPCYSAQLGFPGPHVMALILSNELCISFALGGLEIRVFNTMTGARPRLQFVGWIPRWIGCPCLPFFCCGEGHKGLGSLGHCYTTPANVLRLFKLTIEKL